MQELETAIQHSQRKLKLVESWHKNSWKEFSSNEWRYSSTRSSSSARRVDLEKMEGERETKSD